MIDFRTTYLQLVYPPRIDKMSHVMSPFDLRLWRLPLSVMVAQGSGRRNGSDQSVWHPAMQPSSCSIGRLFCPACLVHLPGCPFSFLPVPVQTYGVPSLRGPFLALPWETEATLSSFQTTPNLTQPTKCRTCCFLGRQLLTASERAIRTHSCCSQQATFTSATPCLWQCWLAPGSHLILSLGSGLPTEGFRANRAFKLLVGPCF